ncbi:MAG: hypothetical protein Kow00117_14750 [Phototrophicales bacterium]
MQISRHWRMNAQRYRLEGVRYENGETSLQARPSVETSDIKDNDTEQLVVVDAKKTAA